MLIDKDKPTIIILEGPDGVGKTSILKSLDEEFVRLNQPKKLDDKIFKISTPKDFAIIKPFIQNLNPKKIYVMDRFYQSNLAYDYDNPSIVEETLAFDKWMRANVNIALFVFTRDPIFKDFEDDNISISKDRFNNIIEIYNDMKSYTIKRLLDYKDGKIIPRNNEFQNTLLLCNVLKMMVKNA